MNFMAAEVINQKTFNTLNVFFTCLGLHHLQGARSQGVQVCKPGLVKHKEVVKLWTKTT